MATPANIGSLVIGAAAGVVGHFFGNLQPKNALMLALFVAAVCAGLYQQFAGPEKKPVKTGRAAKPKPAPKPTAPKKKAKKPAPAKKEAKKSGAAESSSEEEEATPVVKAPAPVAKSVAKAPAPAAKAPAAKAAAPAAKAPAAKAPAAAAKAPAAKAPSPAPKAAPKAAAAANGEAPAPKKKKDKKPKDSNSGSPSAAPATPPVFEPFEPAEDDGGAWTEIPITVPKKRPQKKAAESEKGGPPAPVEKTEIKVPSKVLGTIIGKSGANLQAIQEQCHVKINIPRDKDGRKPSNKEELVTISVEGGSTETRQSARGAIEQLAKTGYSRITHGADYTQQTFTVGSQYVGAIIGNKGETIKEIARLSGAVAVNMDSGSNSITVSGTRVAVAEARRLIDTVVADGFLVPAGAERAEVAVPKGMLGRLCGKSGVNTRRIQRDTNTRIIVPARGSESQNVIVLGSRNDVAQAIKEINACLVVEPAEAPEAPDMSEWTNPVSADDAWDADEAAAAAGPATDGGWSSLAPKPGEAW